MTEYEDPDERALLGAALEAVPEHRTVETHIRSMLAKLGLANSDEDHRRVLAVLLYLSRSN